jgi:hypothetical protein
MHNIHGYHRKFFMNSCTSGRRIRTLRQTERISELLVHKAHGSYRKGNCMLSQETLRISTHIHYTSQNTRSHLVMSMFSLKVMKKSLAGLLLARTRNETNFVMNIYIARSWGRGCDYHPKTNVKPPFQNGAPPVPLKGSWP